MKRLLLLCALLGSAPVLADDVSLPATMPAAYKNECGSCHVPFPPGLLSAANWKTVMAGLERHYGTDAALDAATTAELTNWLTRHAGRRVESREAEPRLTRTAWFLREHDELPARVWRDPRVKSAANCAACHRRAEQGRYGERELDIPGLGRHRERE